MEEGRLYGDTVYSIDELDVPIVVGIGDIGKMEGKDHFRSWCSYYETSGQKLF